MMHMRSLGCSTLVLAVSVLHAGAAAQSRPYTVNVKLQDRPISVSIKAKDARLSDVAADLGARLKAKVVVGPGLRDEKITVDIPETMLETALISLAPRVFVDYEMRQDATPVPLGVYLLGPTDPPPASDAVVRGTSMGVMIEGNTEDVPKKPEEDPLRVTGDRRFLSVMSKKQPLALVARAIGDVLGVPVEIKYDATELIDANLTNGLPEETVTRLSPNIRIYVRVDVNLAEHTPLKLVLDNKGEAK